MDSTALPKGHIIGWAPPPTSSATQTSSAAKSKSAKKNEKRKEKRKEKAVTAVVEKVKDSWEDDDEDDVATQPSKEGGNGVTKSVEVKPLSDGKAGKGSTPDELSEKLEKLEVR